MRGVSELTILVLYTNKKPRVQTFACAQAFAITEAGITPTGIVLGIKIFLPAEHEGSKLSPPCFPVSERVDPARELGNREYRDIKLMNVRHRTDADEALDVVAEYIDGYSKTFPVGKGYAVIFDKKISRWLAWKTKTAFACERVGDTQRQCEECGATEALEDYEFSVLCSPCKSKRINRHRGEFQEWLDKRRQQKEHPF